MSTSVYGIVVAAGQGTRIGFKKQFAPLANVPMWIRSIQALLQAGADCVCAVLPREDLPHAEDSIGDKPWRDRILLVSGGDTRAESVTRGLATVGSHFRSEGAEPAHEPIVLIHDAARPFVREEDVRRLIDEVRREGAAILAVPCKDTVKAVDPDGSITSTVPRDSLWLAQTPQGFLYSLLCDAYRNWGSQSIPTDDASVVEAFGHRVKVVAATGINLKVTTADDLAFAQWQAEQRWGLRDSGSEDRA